MAHKHPGLDEVDMDAAFDVFINAPTMEEAPRRQWPKVVLGLAVAATAGLLLGLLVSDYVTALQVLFVVSCLVTATTIVIWFERKEESDRKEEAARHL